MGKTRAPYPEEFRREAVALVRSDERPIAVIARSLQISDQTLRNWVALAEVDEGAREGLSTDERSELVALRRRVRTLEQEGGPGKSDRLLRTGERSPVEIFRFIAAERASYPVSLMCRVLGVSRSGFYAWLTRPPSARALSDAWLNMMIRKAWKDSKETYGSRRVHAELGHRKVIVGLGRVERLMRVAGISGQAPRKRRRTTIRVKGVRPAPDLVNRDFDPPAPNLLWCADITYLETWQGTLYLAAVQDCFSRRIVGWSMADHMRAELVVDALEMAVARRRPDPGLVHHSDQGSQYVALTFGHAAGDAGIDISMGSVGDCYDNAVSESFFATLKKDLIHRRSWPTKAELRGEVFSYVEEFYNPIRLHSRLGYLSPAVFEERMLAEPLA